MNVTDVQVRLTDDPDSKLKAYCRVILDNALVVHDIKVIDSAAGTFIAMPSRRLQERCPRCRGKNPVLARYCNGCGTRLPATAKPRETSRLHADVVHPLNAESRAALQTVVLAEYEAARRRVAAPFRRPRPAAGAAEAEVEF